MPRKATYARDIPKGDEDDKPDTGKAAVQTVVRHPADQAPPLALAPTVARSVFELAGPSPKPTPRATPARLLKPEAIAIVKGRAIPPPVKGVGSGSVYAQLFDRMAPGDMVELELRTALNFFAWSKRQQKKLALRLLRPGVKGVWRLA